MAKKKTASNAFPRFVFLVYCAVMLWLLFDRQRSPVGDRAYTDILQQNLNLTPLHTIRNYIWVIRHRTDPALVRHCIINLGGNIFLFIPAGFLMPRIFPKQRNLFVFLLTAALCILLVETAQLFSLLGSFDIDDLILNLSGMLMGFSIYYLRYPVT